MEIKPVYEFILWDNCNNHCSFCPQREKCNNLTNEQKYKSLEKVIEFLDSDKYVKGSHILLVGGEIFDNSDNLWGAETGWEWCYFIEDICKKMASNDIDLLYVNTNLLYDNYNLINWMLIKLAEYNLIKKLKFTTSYDLEGRFHTKEREQLFLNNLKKYSECSFEKNKINIVVNTILTKKTCESIINGSFNPKEFCDEYHCDINLIPYIIYNEDLSAEPNDVFKALIKTDNLIPGYIGKYYNNFNLPQDKLLYKYNSLKNEFEYCSSNKLDCGHYENFKLWTKDKDKCFICCLGELISCMAQG